MWPRPGQSKHWFCEVGYVTQAGPIRMTLGNMAKGMGKDWHFSLGTWLCSDCSHFVTTWEDIGTWRARSRGQWRKLGMRPTPQEQEMERNWVLLTSWELCKKLLSWTSQPHVPINTPTPPLFYFCLNVWVGFPGIYHRKRSNWCAVPAASSLPPHIQDSVSLAALSVAAIPPWTPFPAAMPFPPS